MIASHPTAMSAKPLALAIEDDTRFDIVTVDIDFTCCQLYFQVLESRLNDMQFWVSGGRLGYLSSFFNQGCKNDHGIQLNHDLLSIMRQKGVTLANFTFGEKFPRIADSKSVTISYLIANIQDSFNSLDDTIGKSEDRNKIKRMLRASEKAQVTTRITSEMSDLATWYEGSYLSRMAELGGSVWPIETFEKLITEGFAFLRIALVDSQIVGGCIYITSRNVIEIVSIGTKKEFQTLGVNYLLTHSIFKSGYEEGFNYFSWQGSNPPSGGIYQFKKQWDTYDTTFEQRSLTTRELHPSEIEELRNAFPNCFIYAKGV